MTCLPIASPAARAVATACGRGVDAGDHLEQAHERRGVEEVHPHDALGPSAPAAIAVIGIDDVLEARTQTGGDHVAGQRAEDLVLERQRLGRRLDDQLAGREVAERRGDLEPGARPPRRPRRSSGPRSAPLPRSAAMRSRPRCAAPSTGSCTSVRAPAIAASWAMPAPIVPAPTTPMTDGGGGHQPGMSALMPVSARPMISFWICDVPS